MPWATCQPYGLRTPSRIAHMPSSRPCTPIAKLNRRMAKSGRTVSSTRGKGIEGSDGSTSPNSPGMYHRTPRLRRKPHTALKEPRSSKSHTSTGASGSVGSAAGLSTSPHPAGAMLAQLRHGIAPGSAGDFVPLLKDAAARPIGMAARPRFDRRELRVVAQQHQVALAREDAVRAVLQAGVGDVHPVGESAAADVDRHRHVTARFGDDWQFRTGDFFQIGLQFAGRQSGRAAGVGGDDDLRPSGRRLSPKGFAGTRVDAKNSNEQQRRKQNGSHGSPADSMRTVPVGFPMIMALPARRLPVFCVAVRRTG